MPFPTSERVVYEKNPLERVTCQVRFPPILRIEAENPASFQERIRQEFPLFEEVGGADPASSMPPEIAKFLGPKFRIPKANTQYHFLTADQEWRLTLTREFLALATHNYTRWEDFKQHLDLPLKSFVKIYTPAFYSRVGLRYQNVISRSKIGLKEENWSVLLKPHITGELSSSDIANDIVHAARELRIVLREEDSQVQIKHGLVKLEGSEEDCFLIDSDFFVAKQTEVSDAITRLDAFNRHAGHLFRWCITDRLHNAMAPRSI